MANRGINKELTERDKQMLLYLADGMNDKEIAEVLELSYATVNQAFPRILLKLGAQNRYNALYLALKRKLIK